MHLRSKVVEVAEGQTGTRPYQTIEMMMMTATAAAGATAAVTAIVTAIIVTK